MKRKIKRWRKAGKEERKKYIHRARERKSGQCCNYCQFCCDRINFRANWKTAQGTCFEPVNKTSKDWAKFNCRHWLHHVVYLLWKHSLLLSSFWKLGPWIPTNSLFQFHFRPPLTYFPLSSRTCFRALPNTTSFQCPVLSNCFPSPPCHSSQWCGWFQEKGDINRFPLDSTQPRQIGNNDGSFHCEARHLLKSADSLGNQSLREQGALTEPPSHPALPSALVIRATLGSVNQKVLLNLFDQTKIIG